MRRRLWPTACTSICKYASIVVLERMQLEVLLPLMMLRQNIYTDPQKPIQVEPKLYPVGEPGPDSPVIATTNFSLTYFLVSGRDRELRRARAPGDRGRAGHERF